MKRFPAVGLLLVATGLTLAATACRGGGAEASPTPSPHATSTRVATASPAARPTRPPAVTATAVPSPAPTVTPAPTTVPSRTLAERLGVEVRELRLLPAAPLPAGWQLLAHHAPCYQCGAGPGDLRLWTGGPELGEDRLLATLVPGQGYAYSVAHDATVTRIAVGWCRTGYCGGEGDPTPDASAELYLSEDGGATWTGLGDLDVPDSVLGFTDGRLLIADNEVEGGWSVTFRYWEGATLVPPAGIDPDWLLLSENGRPAVWVAYGDSSHLPGQYRDEEGPIMPPLGAEFGLFALFGEDEFLWGALKPPVAEGEEQPESLLILAGRDGTARAAWAWYGEWWTLRGLTADRYVAGYMNAPDFHPAVPLPIVVDLQAGTVLPIEGLPRRPEESFTYPLKLFPGSR